MEHSTLLAAIPNRALARVCPSGCIHVSYGMITLNFGARAFREFVRAVNPDRLLVIGPYVEVSYCRATLRLTAAEFREFAAMVAEAWDRYLRLGPPAEAVHTLGGQRAH